MKARPSLHISSPYQTPLAAYLHFIRHHESQLFTLLYQQWNKGSRFWYLGDQGIQPDNKENPHESASHAVFKDVFETHFANELKKIDINRLCEAETIQQIFTIRNNIFDTLYTGEFKTEVDIIIRDHLPKDANAEAFKTKLAGTITFKLMSFIDHESEMVPGVIARKITPIMNKIFSSDTTVEKTCALVKEAFLDKRVLLADNFNPVFIANAVLRYQEALDAAASMDLSLSEKKQQEIRMNVQKTHTALKTACDSLTKTIDNLFNPSESGLTFAMFGESAKMDLEEYLEKIIPALDMLNVKRETCKSIAMLSVCTTFITHTNNHYPEGNYSPDLRKLIIDLRSKAHTSLIATADIIFNVRNGLSPDAKDDADLLIKNLLKLIDENEQSPQYLAILLRDLAAINVSNVNNIHIKFIVLATIAHKLFSLSTNKRKEIEYELVVKEAEKCLSEVLIYLTTSGTFPHKGNTESEILRLLSDLVKSGTLTQGPTFQIIMGRILDCTQDPNKRIIPLRVLMTYVVNCKEGQMPAYIGEYFINCFNELINHPQPQENARLYHEVASFIQKLVQTKFAEISYIKSILDRILQSKGTDIEAKRTLIVTMSKLIYEECKKTYPSAKKVDIQHLHAVTELLDVVEKVFSAHQREEEKLKGDITSYVSKLRKRAEKKAPELQKNKASVATTVDLGLFSQGPTEKKRHSVKLSTSIITHANTTHPEANDQPASPKRAPLMKSLSGNFIRNLITPSKPDSPGRTGQQPPAMTAPPAPTQVAVPKESKLQKQPGFYNVSRYKNGN